MKNTTKLLALSTVFSAFMFSCSRTPTPAPVTPTYSSIQEVFSQLSLKPKSLTIDAATGGSFFGNSGTRYYFMPNSFQTASGANVTGNVEIQVTEYLDKGDMIFSKLLPVSNGQPLISGGEINIVATQRGQPVFLKPLHSLTANIPITGAPPVDMKLFTGQPVLDTSIIKTNWVLPVRDSSKYNFGIFVVGSDTVKIISDSLNYINCDKFYNVPDLQTFNLTIGANTVIPSSATVDAYVIFDNIKSVMPLLYNITNVNYLVNNIPKVPVHFVAFTLINGKFYGGSVNVTPVTGSNYTITLSQVDPVTFKTQLNQL